MSARYLPAVNQKTNQWSSGLCSCFDDMGICFEGWCCLCCLAAKNSSRMDGETPCCFCCYPSHPVKNRYQLMGLMGIGPIGCCECLVATCCAPCSECQIARELKNFERLASSGMTAAPAHLSMR